MFDFIKNIFLSNDFSTRYNISEKSKRTVTPHTYYDELMLSYEDLVKEQPFISKEEYNALMNNVQKTEKKITNRIEIAKVIKYLTILEEKQRKEIAERMEIEKDRKIYDYSYSPFIIPTIHYYSVYLPLCWNDGFKNIYKESYRVCWYCGDRHQ